MRGLVAACVLLCSCEWGPAFLACGDVDEDAVWRLADARGVLAVYNRHDFICEPHDDVVIDCRNPTAEACTLWLGSAVARGRSFYDADANEGLMPLFEHELTHFGGPRFGDACEDHPPSCDGIPDGVASATAPESTR